MDYQRSVCVFEEINGRLWREMRENSRKGVQNAWFEN